MTDYKPEEFIVYEEKHYRLVRTGEVIKKGDVFTSLRSHRPMISTSAVGKEYRRSMFSDDMVLYYYTPVEIFFERILTPEVLGELFDD